MTLRRFFSRSLALAVLWTGSIAFVGQSHGQTQTDPAAPCPGVLSDTEGEIAEVLLNYDPDLATELEPIYQALFGSLAGGVRVLIICASQDAAVAFVSDWHTQLAGRDVTVINVGFPVSIWARDRYVSRQPIDLSYRADGFVPITDTNYEPEKHNELLAHEMLGLTRLMPNVLDSALFIEGGNIVSNSRNVFIGANVLKMNEDLALDELSEDLDRLAGRPFVFVGDHDGEVPWCHVDMYLTPIGDQAILVASPRMAERIGFGEQTDEDASEHENASVICAGDALHQRFDDVAERLKGLGYRVLRIPAVITSPGESMITYNNVIMDHRGDKRIVYMPTYDIPMLDNVAAAVYQSLGFEVHEVDVSEVFHNGGALRCLVNVTERRLAGFSGEKVMPTGRLRFKNLAERKEYEHLLSGADDRLARRGRRDAVPAAVGILGRSTRWPPNRVRRTEAP